ncbi:MAG: hypothetical protein ACJ8FS_09130, partial [Sphingomicrobium sp.]
MDDHSAYPSDFDPSAAAPAPDDLSVAIGTDERRMHVRAYNYWVSLLEGRDFPTIEELEPSDVEDFAAQSVLLDFTCGRDNPAMPYVGAAIREECGLDDSMRTIAEVPSRSLLSRLTDHYMQIIANRAPVGFEAEFENPRGESICYRGILMPFSSDGDTIDFIYGVINWKHVDEAAAEPSEGVMEMPFVEFAEPEAEVDPAIDAEPLADDKQPLELTEPTGPVAAEDDPVTQYDSATEFEPEPEAEPEPVPVPVLAEAVAVHFSWEDAPVEADDEIALPVALDAGAGLADRLWAARETAESVKAGEGRTRAALYKALALAYDFAIAALQNPDEYAELLEESGVKAQTRAPMTPIVKLVFGIDYDKARLT